VPLRARASHIQRSLLFVTADALYAPILYVNGIESDNVI
jgi:hypothetical protein